MRKKIVFFSVAIYLLPINHNKRACERGVSSIPNSIITHLHPTCRVWINSPPHGIDGFLSEVFLPFLP